VIVRFRRVSTRSYYVEGRETGGATIARIATPDQPLEIALAAGGIDVVAKRPWYARW